MRAAAEESAFLIPAAAQLQLQYQGIRCPVRILHGKGDRFIEADENEENLAAAPTTTDVELPTETEYADEAPTPLGGPR